MLCATLRAQDLEPRAYSNLPIGLSFLIAGYGYAEGSVLTDPSVPLDNVSNNTHGAVLAYATTLNVLGQSAKLDVIVPYVLLAAKGLVLGLPRARYITGFADPAFRFSMNFIGAPALTAAEFKDYQQDFILGASLRVVAPLGQYDNDKLVNIGTNRWSFKPEIGFSKAFGPWTVEFTPGVTFYTDNGDFFGGKTREVAPLVALQAGTRFGATLALPVNRYHSVKLYGMTGYNADRDHDFQAVGLAWQYRFGGGF
jgi:hypothetical protein